MKYISTSSLSKRLGINSNELVNFLIKNGYIIIKRKSLLSSDKIKVLTDKGKNIGGKYKESNKFGKYIVWPEDFNPIGNNEIDMKDNIIYKTVSELSNNIENISGKKLNTIISELGRMEHNIKGWELTKLGKNIGGKQYIYEKTGKRYIKWPENILEDINLKNALYTGNSDKIVQKKQKDDELLFREKFPANSRAKDGHMVRSRGEMLIDNALYEYKLVHAYERKLPIKEDVYSDFYIPSQKGGKAVYIEYWGYDDNNKYLERKRKKIEIYKKYELNLIEIENKHIDNLDDFLPRMLLEFGIKVD